MKKTWTQICPMSLTLVRREKIPKKAFVMSAVWKPKIWEGIKNTYETFQKQIEELDEKSGCLEIPDFEEWKEKREPNLSTISKMYSNLYNTKDGDSVISNTWHDIQLWIDVKF